MGVSVYWPKSVLYVFVCLYVSVCVCVRSNKSSGKKPHYVSDLSKLIVCTSPPLSARGFSLLPNFQKGGRGLDRISIFRGGLLGKRGVTFFRGLQFLQQKK